MQFTRNFRRFPFTKNSGNFPLGISVWEERVPFATSSIRGSRGTPGRLKDRERSGLGDKNNKHENSVNGTQIFHWEVSTGKTGLPLQQFRLFRKIFSGTNQKVVFHLHPNRNFLNFLVNGKRPLPPSVVISQWTCKGFPFFSGSIQYLPSFLETPRSRISLQEWAGSCEYKPGFATTNKLLVKFY